MGKSLLVPLSPSRSVALSFQFRSSLSSEAKVWIFYDTTDISESEEYLLYDFNAIVAAAGGSLGLFMGIRKRKKERRGEDQ